MFAVGPDGAAHRVSFNTPYSLGLYNSQTKWFVTIPKGERAGGEVKVSLAALDERFASQYPMQFGRNAPRTIACQLVHKPFDRGGSLDAWTGEVYGPFTVFRLDR